MSIDIAPLRDDAGLVVTDHIENAQFEVYTDRSVDPEPAPLTDHYFPVDASVTVAARWIEIPRDAVLTVHGADGEMRMRGDDFALRAGDYHVGVDPAPTKLYLSFEAGFSVRTTGGSTIVEFDGCTEVALGFRSLHQVPAGTITTPTDPASVMDAVSLLGSSLSTTSPERSFPTLRGHPPLIEPGETFSVPDRVEPLDSGIRIVIPPAFEYLYPVVSLAYYFAAEVVSGEHPRIEGDGWEYPLGPDFEATTANVLRQSFYLDCITRTEGFYPVTLHERETTGLDLDWERLYNLPLAERLGEYLDVPFERIEPELPQWTLTTDIRPDPGNLELLPFVAGELSLIRSPDRRGGTPDPESGPESDPDHVSEFFRAPAADGLVARGPAESGTRTTGSGRSTGFTPDDADFIEPDPVSTTEHAWVGDGVPLGANKTTLEAYHRRLRADAVGQSRISVLVVCNDEQMREEGDVAELYGLRDMVQFDIAVRHDLTREEMRGALREDVDFLHYIGHVDERGMQCLDGFLDLTSERLDVGISAFLLNACQSYRQGESLVSLGARGGIVTLSDVANTPATRLGRIIARLMNGGFNLRIALHVAKQELITGHQYIVVGDGATTICQSRSGVAVVASIRSETDGSWSLAINSYPNGPYGVGTLTAPAIAGHATNYTVPAEVQLSDVTSKQLEGWLQSELLPVFHDGTLTWSDELVPLKELSRR
ncbi:hypothetical protein JCM17823_15170 [Halorubrum gandharaense]